ncbi:MAG TPA: PEP-CTERM sorting domain-containing protein, partial [Tepidisphaeraceae bacterium]|nr:PEP-CTERM sorting domain-containing protein [Tepidisphaeraceae bacterium]
TNNGTLTAAGVRVEWHEAGSVEGILELANDQIGYFTPDNGVTGGVVDPFTPRGPSGGNPLWINRNKLSATNATGPSSTSFSVAPSNYNTYLNYSTLGTNLQGGQNRVQMAISDVVPLQGFSNSGSGTFTSAYNLRPGDVGYGKGNTALSSANNLAGLGQAGVNQQLVDGTKLNMDASKINPSTGVSYGTGAWNSGTINNLVTKSVAVTATVFTANPGTGLTNLNKTDAQWLQLTGRLKNGLDFNMTERDPNSGTRNVAALNTGVDPSWAVGEDDGGNGYGAGSAGTLECAIGPTLHFSGKTAGGGLLRPTVQNNRMAIGVLSMSDAIGATGNTDAGSTNTNNAPLRALAYADKASDDMTLSSSDYVQPNASTITKGDYVIWQKEQYVTVRDPSVANYSSDEVAKGDTQAKPNQPKGDIITLRDNVLNSVNANFPNPSTFSDPADQLLANSFLLPQMMVVDKATDGGTITPVGDNVVTLGGGGTITQSGLRMETLAVSSVTKNFDTLPGANVTSGSGALYGVTSNTSISFTGAGGVNVPITAEDSSGNPTLVPSAPKGNYMFGNFNQNGVRDFSAVIAALTAQQALDTGANASANIDVANVSVSNNTKFTGISAALDSMNGGSGPTKGDLIVMGDFNGDGKFDGKDLYLMARGAAVSDASSNATNFNGGTLTATASTFGDAVRSAQLRKNDALDYLNTHIPLGAPERNEASANSINDPTGANAFNKFDVNRDGLVNRTDAQIVDHFIKRYTGAVDGSDVENYTSLSDQLNATLAVNGTINPAAAQKPVSLVDIELNDNGKITNIASGAGSDGSGSSDFKLIRQALGSSLTDGDADFNGSVGISDFNTLAMNFGTTGQMWSAGDFNFDGVVNLLDLNAIATNFGVSASAPVALGTLVPEPGSIGIIMAACGLAFGSRSRKRR